MTTTSTTPTTTPVAAPAHGTPTILDPFVRAGILSAAEVQLAATIDRLAASSGTPADPLVLLGLAVTARGFRAGHVCMDLSMVEELLYDEAVPEGNLPWPDPDPWIAVLRRSPLLVHCTDDRDPGDGDPGDGYVRPLVLDGTSLYLHRHWNAEVTIAGEVLDRLGSTGTLGFDAGELEATLERFFGPETVDGETDWQRAGAKLALTNAFSVLAGGPGTGKTRTIAHMLAVAHTIARLHGRKLLVAAAAPSGKAAARMGEAIEQAVERLASDSLIDDDTAALIRSTPTMTIHRLLGANPRRGFIHDAGNPLSHDIVIVDESSMIDLPLMAALLEATPHRCHLVFVGDPAQLASVRAGTVLGDIVAPATTRPTDTLPAATLPAATRPTDTLAATVTAATSPLERHITVLRRVRRFGTDSRIAALATAIRSGDADATMDILSGGSAEVDWVRPDDYDALRGLAQLATASAIESVRAALDHDVDGALTHLGALKVLAAMHHQPLGVIDWGNRIEAGLFAAVDPNTVRIPWTDWYIGRPVIVTRNDSLLRIANGDVGTTIDHDGVVAVAFEGNPQDRLEIPTARLDDIETWWAMTIHKSQGSEFGHAIVSLPSARIPILTRELLYTGVTRAKERVTVIGAEDVIRAAVERPISRASVLGARLWNDPSTGAARSDA